MMDLEVAKEEFFKYANNFDISNENIERKIKHSLRVMKVSERLAIKIGLNKEEIQVATLIGLLHDIGRFEQYTKFKTYRDHKSIDHGDLGAKILEENNYIRKFISTNQYDEIIKKAIKNHNKYELEEGLTKEEELFCKLVKDADKIDILYESIEILWKNVIDEMENSKISKEVEEEFYEEKLIRNEVKVSDIDELVGIISFIYDIFFQESILEINNKNYINLSIDRFNFKVPETNEKMKKIKEYANNYIKQKIK